MASNMLDIPFRRTHSVSLAEALKQYISNNYDQHPDMFKQDLDAIDKQRMEAVTVLEPHVSGVRKIAMYAAQLVWIGGKFPIDIGVEFAWYPALGFNTQSPVSESNLRFELANVLFNLAALYSQLAYSLNRTTSEGLKSASSYLCQAAGVIEYLKTDILPDMRSTPPEDMDTATLESVQQLLLAQAQECSWSMAIKNGYKDALIAKLAAKVSDFYDQAAEHGTRSDTVSTEWIHHMSAKHHHFAAAAQYRAACDCLDKRKYGEEVARLKDSLTCVNEALKESKWINKTVLADLNGLKVRVAEDLKRAEKDNDLIYLANVTPKSELKTLERASMAVPKRPSDIADPTTSFGDRGVFGQPLFHRLVPYAVHLAASIYADRRDRIVNASIIDELEALTSKLRDLLQSLNLPGSLQAMEKPLGLPASLTAYAEEIRQQQGLHRLRRIIHEVETIKENDITAYKEGVSFLEAEASEDDQARKKYGTDRWSRPNGQQAAEKLYTEAGEIDGYLKSANNSDQLVKKKLKDCEDAMRILEGTNRDLEDYVPSSRRTTMPPNVEKEASRLRAILDDVSRLESRRRRKAEALREKAKADDINPSLLAETARLEREFPMQKVEAVQFENLFDKRLERYDEDRKSVRDEHEEQEHLAAKLRETNAAFQNARKGDTSSREREKALQKLENAYGKYKEILSNLETGKKFYNDLARIVNKFHGACREFRYQRRVEAGQIETDLSNAMSSMSLAHTNALQDQKEREHLRSQFNANKAATGEPMTAPMPTRANVAPQPPAGGMWTPEMGIKFASQSQPPLGQPNDTHKAQYPVPPKGSTWMPGSAVRFS